MFQGPQAEKEAARWEGTSTTPQKKISPQTTTLPADFGNWSVIGSDEVGNGSYFGPVTVCAAYVDKSMISKLKSLGVRDSKELTDPQRQYKGPFYLNDWVDKQWSSLLMFFY